MKKKKLIAVAIILALALLIGGMIAYFTDTDTATNVFTIGDEVDISLDEDWTDGDGDDLHPGATVTKAPSIVNESTTTPAYVFAEIVVPCYDSSDPADTVDTPLFTFTPNAGWYLLEASAVDTTNKTITYVYAYGSSTAMTSLAASATTNPVFNSVTLDPDLTADQAATASATPNIIVNAYGIQTDNVGTTPAAVWANF